MSALGYRLALEQDDNGTWFGTCPDMPEVSLFGETKDAAQLHAIGAIEEAIARRLSDWVDIPPMIDMKDATGDEFAPLPLLTALKLQLYQALRENGVSRADLVRALNCHREQVDRLFRLDHQSKVSQIEDALNAVGVKVKPVLEVA